MLNHSSVENGLNPHQCWAVCGAMDALAVVRAWGRTCLSVWQRAVCCYLVFEQSLAISKAGSISPVA